MKEFIEYAKASRKGSDATVEFLMVLGVDGNNHQLAMACDPVKKDEEYTINDKTFSVKSVKEFYDKEAGFVRRDCLLEQS